MEFPGSVKEGKIKLVGAPVHDGDHPGLFDRAPDRIRELAREIETFSPYFLRDLADIGFSDLGNTEDPRPKPLTVFMGGDHSLTQRTVPPGTDVLYLDAHADLLQAFKGNSRSHATTARHLIKNHRVVFMGVRSFTEEEWRILRGLEWSEGLEDISGRFYLSVDMDVFDPSHAPGVIYPEPGGITPREFFSWLRDQEIEIVGADIVEYVPSLDLRDLTGILAAKVVREILMKMALNLECR